jgi:hypothetical protein
MSTANSPKGDGSQKSEQSMSADSDIEPSAKSGVEALSSDTDVDMNMPSLDKNQVLITLFEKMGVPLINAISAVEMWQKMDSAEETDLEAEHIKYATNLASLLNRTVSLSTALSDKLELPVQKNHKHRLDVAAVSTLMVAHQYALTAKIPEEADIAKMTDSMQSVLSFADYFSSSADVMEASSLSSEALMAQCLDAVVPLAHTVERFSFGKQGKALLSDILDQLGKRVTDLAKALGQDMDERAINAQKIQIFKSSAQLFTLCYEGEMNALVQSHVTTDTATASTPEDQDVDQALGRIWTNFDARVDLLRIVLGYVNQFFTGDMNANAEKRTSKSATVKKMEPENKEEKVVDVDAANEKPAAPTGFSPIQAVLDRAEGKDVSKQESSGDEDGGGDGKNGGKDGDSGNPMSFFTGK